MPQANLSETLFKPRFKHPETSTLVRRFQQGEGPSISSALDGRTDHRWYRLLNRLLWVWRGVDPREIIEVLSRIAASKAERTSDDLFDTVVGYRGGNWIYEWSKQAMVWQQKAGQQSEPARIGREWLTASNLYSIAAYPFIKGDSLSEQALVLANRAYSEAAEHLGGSLRQLDFSIPGGSDITGFLHLPDNVEGPCPTVLLCGGLDSLQSDYYTLFERYFAPLGMAMLTIDVPSVGLSSKWTLTQDTSLLHQHVLQSLRDVPWVDHTRVAAFGFRFGANIAVRLGYLEAGRLKAVACLGPIVHSLLIDPLQQGAVPEMYLDVLASRLGMADASDSALRVELNRYSLKTQGLLGRRCPTPMLSGYWDNDPFSPEEESRLIVSSSCDGKLLQIPFRPVYRNFDKALSQTAEWMRHRLG
ncbi:esterase FrsA [Shimwellia blattae]|uniref:Esterase FrsA n=1 Tax=Shimwellia blattae (strain ATCC 29907 / DSM 4481 / JCM 1650 / NBRC 105725 / CDC 9005-74) TaxID=630626 RepID=I2BCD6_SHIBC|nr:esterase FrsA [Shimwellia blattae]AFJ48190.1 hydrolase of the alpha/beta superfamily [Shimwellia blattae DSM 4481 = NBRC 105725]GAB82749.1 esterase FrsA [Shimwellia blattae DSM 4481 = NBRC 105725]VDY65686.1 fermentation/respiration switch protein [Shimwellia blattae]VEC25370.1 fermentation/respiration switch protein [Shimwellia blattae]